MSILHTVRQAARGLRRRPGTALTAVGILGVGIGASVAVFAVLSAVLLDPLPYADPDRLVLVEHRGAAPGSGLVSGPDAAAYAGAAAVEGVGYVRDVRDAVLEGPDGPEAIRAGVASSSLFAILGVRPIVGRLPAPPAAGADADDTGADEDGEDAAPPPRGEALVSHAFWRDRLGGRGDVVGTALVVDGAAVVVAGVLPPGFRLVLPPAAGLPDRADVWVGLPVPLEAFRRPDRLRDQDSDNRGVVVARLAVGVALEAAESELAGIRRRLAGERGQEGGQGVDDVRVAVRPLQPAATAAARPVLLALFAAVLLVLALTAANVGALLLARSAERGPELAVRAALGAGRGGLAALVACEGLVIGVGAGVLGLFLGAWGRDLLLAFHPAAFGPAPAAPFDAGLLAFAALATLAATVLAAALPAWRAARPGALSTLRTDAARSASGGVARVRRLLVVAEIACALALLTGAGLLTRTVLNLGAVDPGFDAAPVTTFELALIDRERYRGPADRGRLVRTLMDRLETLPSITAAGVIGGLPLTGEAFTQPWGRPGEPPEEWSGSANFRVVSDRYFAAVGTPLVAGRAFVPADDRQDVRVVVVDRAFAERLAGPGRAREAVGRSVALPLDGQAEVARIVGVVEGVRFEDLRAPGAPAVYVPYRHEASRRITVAVRGVDGGPVPSADLAAAVAAIDPGLPLFAYAPMRDHVRRATADTRFALAVLAGFAALASLLAALGVYALVARWVAGRTAEIGIRMAMGADPRRVARLVLAETLRMLGPGIAAGLVAGVALGRGARALLFEVGPLDPVVLGSVTVLLSGAALAASLLPTRRAARLQPSEALRA